MEKLKFEELAIREANGERIRVCNPLNTNYHLSEFFHVHVPNPKVVKFDLLWKVHSVRFEK